MATLKPWRDVIAPHPDVASGRYVQAEFAADMAQVLRGNADAEYQDPLEFFRRTYLTAGMTGLLRSALQRLSGGIGDPVIQLKTAFGGGKTHSLLALYHLLSGSPKLMALEAIKEIVAEAGLERLPQTAKAVLVGTSFDPTRGRAKPELGPGAEVRTLWGEMAWQLAGRRGYQLVAEADARGVAPGGDALDELFEMAGPCVILIDELVAYVRNIGRTRGLLGGTLGSNMTFVQNLTESVKRSPTAVLVAAIPESAMEIGGPDGEEVLRRLEHIFGRLEAVWKPVEAHESFEVVRRRLFSEIVDEVARDETCRTFATLYRNNLSDFPVECRELEYERRLRGSYPIHPEMFDRLYEDWSTLERFQRTRGVLRLMAAVIHQLWATGDSSPLIMPGSLPLYAPRVRDELTRYLADQWNSVIDSDVDGDNAEPARIDSANPRFGQVQAARRLARTILLGSVPAKATRGIEDVRILLGVVQPDEGIAIYNDALRRLQQHLQYLYDSGSGRFWYDVQPNLTRTIADRSSRISEEESSAELEKRLRDIRDRGEFARVHICPRDTGDVPDEAAVRMVIMSQKYGHRRGERSLALERAGEILNQRGSSPRHYRNMLVFAAADKDDIQALADEVRLYLAWKSVQSDAAVLNLDHAQMERVNKAVDRANQTVDVRLDAGYQWAMIPRQETGTSPIEWEVLSLRGGDLASTGPLVQRTGLKLQQQELLITNWSPIHLKRALDEYLWADGRPHLGIRQLWDYFARYPYLARLKNHDVLLSTIRSGVVSRDFFGYATGIAEDGSYAGLTFGTPPPGVYFDDSSVVVRREVAARQVTEPGPKPEPQPEPGPEPTQPTVTAPRRFYGTVQLDPLKITSSTGTIAEEVIQHLQSILGAEVEVTLEIEARVPDGIPDHVQRIIGENANTLKFEVFGFEEG